jgi:hypothetical protein
VFDHFQALVNTIAVRLREDRSAPTIADRVGGSTYTYEVWPGHPLENEVLETLSRVRSQLGDLRSRVEAHRVSNPVPSQHTRVVVYAGQCLIPQEGSTDHEAG